MMQRLTSSIQASKEINNRLRTINQASRMKQARDYADETMVADMKRGNGDGEDLKSQEKWKSQPSKENGIPNEKRKLRIDKQVVEVPCFNTLFKLWWLMDDVVFFLASLKPSGKEYQARHLVRLATTAWPSSSGRGEDVEAASCVGSSKYLFIDRHMSLPG
ncbi:unnamed protein product [Cochlearia groenlandica]